MLWCSGTFRQSETRLEEAKDIAKKTFRFYGIELRPIGPWDLPALRRWRNSPEINKNMLDTSFITPQRQRQWYQSIIDREDQAHWVVWCQGQRAGYSNVKGDGPLYKQQKVEVGGYIGASGVRHVLLGYALVMSQLDVAFEHIGVEEVQIFIKGNNERLIQFNEKIGYCPTLKTAEGIFLSLREKDYQVSKKRMLKYFK
ncbi:MAG: GNAT family N-acetyltransferase [Myxococcota bacterium]|jgi:RimJ/RimL family protein N-acetyltransferase|nr:GNAT family N-acetyltransferase [Myxococcota bacterium]